MRLKPLLIFDGDCNFCRRWIGRWKRSTKEKVDYEFSQAVGPEFPEIPKEKFQASVLLVETDGKTFGGAEAVFRTLAYAPGRKWMLECYKKIPGVRFITEGFYRTIASHRVLFSRLTGFLWGKNLDPPAFDISSWIFLKCLGLIYLMAFVSLGVQIQGLIGSDGILPAQEFLQEVGQKIGPERYWFLPSLAWFNASDACLHLMWGTGAVLSVLLLAGVLQIPVLFLLWVLYLSITVISREFLSFQRSSRFCNSHKGSLAIVGFGVHVSISFG